MSEIPLSDEVLDNIEHSMKGYLTYEGNDLVFRGADFQLSTYLDFLAGVHGDKGTLDRVDDDGTEWYIQEKPTFSERDLIKALIDEVRRLRNV